MSVPTVRDVVAHLLTLDRDLPAFAADDSGAVMPFKPKRHARVVPVRPTRGEHEEDFDEPPRSNSYSALVLGVSPGVEG